MAGYDLLNEPDPPSGEALVALYRRIVHGIREVDRGHLVILEGSGFATDFSMFTEPLDPNAAYSFHLYSWLGDRRRADLDRYARIARAQGVPFWCGEFGQNTYAMVAGTLERFTARPGWLAGWAMWTWKQAPGKYPALNAIHPPAAFLKLMSHLVDGDGRTPEAAGAERALGGFLDAAAYDRTVHDRQLGEILSHYAAAPPVEAPPRPAQQPPAAGVRSRRAGGGSR